MKSPMAYFVTQLSKPRIAQKVAALMLLLGLALLLIEVRFEHQAVLGKKWQAWIPIIYSSIMLVAGGVSLTFWDRGGRLILKLGFGIAPVVGLTGFWLHSKGDPWMAMCMVLKVICMMPGKIPLDGGGPPVLAPLALAGLGLLGLVICQPNCAEVSD
ncbi:MAG: hypothetical protein JST01_22810 [Cyanobacteria bacterium SZAS TMP-1]|nr:hypothetical protein [Cyanobacteria bacterium SZAS TMP-1]